MRELQQILERVGFIAGGGLPINSFNFFAQWGELATAYVQPARGRVSIPGWENEDVAFGKDVPRDMISEAEALVHKYYKFRYFASVTVGGRRYWIMTLRRASAVYGFATGGSAPQPVIDPTWLYFTMPEGGTISLTKNGAPADVVLEYSLDNGSTWTEWVESAGLRTMTLNEGQTMHVRNTSATSTGFSLGGDDYYSFDGTGTTEAGGNLDSLLCKNPEDAVITAGVYRNIFNNFTGLTKAPMMPSVNLAPGCYRGAYTNTSIEESPILPATVLQSTSYYGMFRLCSNLKKVTTYMTDISATNCLSTWMNSVGVAGDFYCPAELTIPSGSSGIPTGWIRHDI